MKRFAWRWVTGLVTVAMMGLGGVAWADGMTREQGDAILKELQEIHRLLKPLKGLEVTPQTPTPSAPRDADRVRVGLGDHPVLGDVGHASAHRYLIRLVSDRNVPVDTRLAAAVGLTRADTADWLSGLRAMDTPDARLNQ